MGPRGPCALSNYKRFKATWTHSTAPAPKALPSRPHCFEMLSFPFDRMTKKRKRLTNHVVDFQHHFGAHRSVRISTAPYVKRLLQLTLPEKNKNNQQKNHSSLKLFFCGTDRFWRVLSGCNNDATTMMTFHDDVCMWHAATYDLLITFMWLA